MPLSLKEAQTVIDVAHGHARSIGIRVTVAIVDEGGQLQALGRMDGAARLSPQIAESKAVGAALWHRDGASLASLRAERPAFFEQVVRLTRLPIMPALGSVLIQRDDAVLGAVGVSGGPSELDLECAEAGLQALGLLDEANAAS